MTVTNEEARAIAKEAYIYGWPMSEGYNLMYDYAIDDSEENLNYKAAFNVIKNEPTVYDHTDDAVVTPNSDTPYSFIWADLRAEPIVIRVPAFPAEEGRYYSFQLIDLYTHNFEYIGTRTTGREEASFLIAGPSWKGDIPEGINHVFRSETDFFFSVTRTQLFNPEDLGNVAAIQNEYEVKTLSQILGVRPLTHPAEVSWPAPIRGGDLKEDGTPEEGRTPAVFKNINFMLQFCPVHRSEMVLMDRFAKIGIGPGLDFDVQPDTDMWDALQAGIEDAWAEFEMVNQRIEDGGLNSGDLFGTRQYLLNNYLYRFAGAKIGIYGNSKDEAMYPMYSVDAEKVDLDGSKYRYTLNLTSLPADAFASVTMYDGETQLLIENTYQPEMRYLVNTTMKDDLVAEGDSVTIYIQRDAPAEGSKEYKNWLPAPDGPFYMAMRLYVPQERALDGTWTPPPVENVGAVSSDGTARGARSQALQPE